MTNDAENKGAISDGYHTFDELYAHRAELFITLCKVIHLNPSLVWRSRLHDDGSSFPGWFVLGISIVSGEQITYHLKDEYWDETAFAFTIERAMFDGHTSQDVLLRLRNLRNS